jgi:hypothetical protein
MRSKDVKIGMRVEVRMGFQAIATAHITGFDSEKKMVRVITEFNKQAVVTHIRNVRMMGV